MTIAKAQVTSPFRPGGKVPIHKIKHGYKTTGGVRMSRASEHTTLLPLSGLLLALLMIASLLGLQGAIDRALTFQLSPSRLTAPLNQALTGPPLIARQPVGRAAEAAASAEASPAGPARRSVASAVANVTEAGVSPMPLVEPSMTKLSMETPEEIVKMSLFKPKKIHSAKRLTAKSTWGKRGEDTQLFQSSSEPLAHGKTAKPAKTNGRSRNSGR